jgi:alkanesulfonate monooxygenase SsuD/methylene tetrahydromethanopterin reductase-like flavin-dependent oxidoreductase (luciferase family)
LTAAGAISARLRLRTYVLNAGFWNPALLAREVATAIRRMTQGLGRTAYTSRKLMLPRR